VALALFLYAYFYRPTQLHPTYKAHIDNPPASTEAADRSIEPKVRIKEERHHALISDSMELHQHAPSQVPTAALTSALTLAATEGVASAPPSQAEDKKPNVFRRILNFFKRLFRGRRRRLHTNEAPVLQTVAASNTLLVRECPAGAISESCQPSENQTVRLVATVSDIENDQLSFEWSVSGGRIIGEGASVDWDLSGVANGKYNASVTVSDGGSKKVTGDTSVVIEECADCKKPVVCPTVIVKAAEVVIEGKPIEFTASVTPLPVGTTFNWSLSAAKFIGDKGGSTIRVDTSGIHNERVMATVTIGGLPSACSVTASGGTFVKGAQAFPALDALLFTEYRALTVDEENARLRGLAAILQGKPSDQAAIVSYGKCKNDDATARANRAKDYLVSTLNIEGYRIHIVNGCHQQGLMQLWVVPKGASMPENEGVVCPECTVSIAPEKLNSAKLSGIVMDMDGNAMAYASVTLVGANTKRVTKSSANGTFAFADLPAGSYDILVGSGDTGDFATHTYKGIELRAGQDLRLSEPMRVSKQALTTRYKLRDIVRMSYPDHFLEEPPADVSFEWNREFRPENETVTSQTNTNGRFEITDQPPPVPGATPNVPVTEAQGRQYVAFAKVTLLTEGLTVLSAPSKLEQSLSPDHVSWSWKVKPTDSNAKLASIQFRVEIIWRGEGLPEKTSSFLCQKQFAPIGPPLKVKVARFGARSFAVCALFTFGFGLRRKFSGLVASGGVVAALPIDAGSEEVIEEDVIEEDVSSSVFAPRQASPGSSFLVQVYAHLPGEETTTLKQKAGQVDPAAEQAGGDLLEKKVRRGATLMFTLSMNGLEIDKPQQSRPWQGRTTGVQFGVTVPKGFAPCSLYGRIVISVDRLPIGDFAFAFKVVAQPTAEPDPTVFLGVLRRYQHAFISYAHEDRAEVLKRVQMLNILKQKYFQDFITLEPGEVWEPAIQQAIEKSDVIFLFWSKAASGSEWVKKEILYAVARRAGDENAPPAILPVIIEGPPPATPPAELSFLQFDDKFSYWIFAAEAEAHEEQHGVH
jgi:hypothetical protein